MEPFDPLDPRAYDPVDENPPPLPREPTRADVVELILLVSFIFALIALVLLRQWRTPWPNAPHLDRADNFRNPASGAAPVGVTN